MAEGSANKSINVVFLGEERVNFIKKVLFPLVGLDSKLAEQYYAI
jgi:hypothetical protein